MHVFWASNVLGVKMLELELLEGHSDLADTGLPNACVKAFHTDIQNIIHSILAVKTNSSRATTEVKRKVLNLCQYPMVDFSWTLTN
jgi:hypothetical protein